MCVENAQIYLPIIFEKRQLPSGPALNVLAHLKSFLQVIDKSLYQERAEEAKQRIKSRDLYDWSIVATALLLNCHIWTEDQDFFGTGVPIWTTDRIHLFFESAN